MSDLEPRYRAVSAGKQNEEFAIIGDKIGDK